MDLSNHMFNHSFIFYNNTEFLHLETCMHILNIWLCVNWKEFVSGTKCVWVVSQGQKECIEWVSSDERYVFKERE